jgi:hypothetical protein
MEEELKKHQEAEQAFNDSCKDFRARLEAWCQDTTIDLDRRWDVFCSAKLGEDESWYSDELQNWGLVNNYDVFGDMNRYQIYYTDDMSEWVPKELYDSFREKVLSIWLKSMRYEW